MVQIHLPLLRSFKYSTAARIFTLPVGQKLLKFGIVDKAAYGFPDVAPHLILPFFPKLFQDTIIVSKTTGNNFRPLLVI